LTKTSITDPLRIESVEVPGTGGRIGMTLCPGKKKLSAVSGAWDRDIDLDLAAIGKWGAKVLVSLIEPEEYGEVGVEDLPARASGRMLHLRLPIRDVSVPGLDWEAAWDRESPKIRSVLRRGGRVCVHCMGGLGRTGLAAALLLVEFGMEPDEAIRLVRKARPGAIETRGQEDYIRARRAAAERLGRFRGCLLAGAAGDALGAPVEFLSKAQILDGFGPRGITEYAPAYGRLGAITDDTQMTLFTAEGLLRGHVRLELKGLASTEDCVNHAYYRWLATQGMQIPGGHFELDGWLVGHKELFSRRAPGNTCLSGLASQEEGESGPVARNNSKGCGGVMRAAPVGLFASTFKERIEDARAWAFRTGCAAAAMSHGHPSGQYPAGLLAAIVYGLVESESLPAATASARVLLDGKPEAEETLRALDGAVELARSGRPADECIPRLGQGWVGEEALAIALFCALRADGLEAGIVMAVNIDGDSDSTGSIAGNLLGAMWGARSIPERWLAGLELRDVIAGMADDLSSAGEWLLAGDAVENAPTPLGRLEWEDLDHWWEKYPGW
jgi:ADP-ribosylglycohydrolase/protein-tyrosine phosphatase